MVRYSKLPFRLLLRSQNVDVIYTPMILAHEFIRSQIARDSDFTTSPVERRDFNGRPRILIAQFASSDPEEFARAADLISPWVDGVDLNCGCPQSWARKEGIGCSLMEDRDLVMNMVRAAKDRLGNAKSVSCKIRIHADLERTIEWVQKVVDEGGVDFITVHGRTRNQRSSTPPDYEAIRRIKKSTRVPVVANGDAWDFGDVDRIAEMTNVNGVMAARGLLESPALFEPARNCYGPSCARSFLELAIRHPIPFPLALHHVAAMTVGETRKQERKALMACRDLVDLVDFVKARWPNHACTAGSAVEHAGSMR